MKLPLRTSNKSAAPNRRRISDRPVSQMRTDNSYLFARNRTITGSRSASIASATERDAQLQSPRATVHSLRRRQRSLMASVAAIGLFSCLLIVLLYQFSASSAVSIYGQVKALDSSNQNRYTALIDDYLARHPAERLRWWLDSDQLAAYLQQRGATEVKAIYDVQPQSFGTTAITLQMREPLASWVIDGRQQYVDDSGTVFAVNYFETPSVRIIDESGLKPSDSHTVASSRFLSFIGQSVGQFNRFELPPKAVIIPPNTTRQVQILLAGKLRVKLSIDRPAGEQAEDAARATAYLTSRRLSAEYVDVRVGGKAFYRN